MEEKNLTAYENPTNIDIGENDTRLGQYCSYLAYWGRIIAVMERKDIDTERLNERLYFRAIEKLGIVNRGIISEKNGDISFIKNRAGSHYPPLTQLINMGGNDEAVEGIYRRKRGTFGFNCANETTLEDVVMYPVITLLTKMINELNTTINKLIENKQQIKQFGMNVSDAKKITADKIINRYL